MRCFHCVFSVEKEPPKEGKSGTKWKEYKEVCAQLNPCLVFQFEIDCIELLWMNFELSFVCWELKCVNEIMCCQPYKGNLINDMCYCKL